MRVQLHPDHAALAHDGTDALDDVAFYIVVAMRHHCAVQAQQDAVQRHGGAALFQDFVAHRLVVALVGGAGGAGGEAASLDQGEPLCRGAAARHEQRRGAHQGRLRRVLAGAEIDAFLVCCERGRERGEGVAFSGQRGGENAHAVPLPPAPAQHGAAAGQMLRALDGFANHVFEAEPAFVDLEHGRVPQQARAQRAAVCQAHRLGGVDGAGPHHLGQWHAECDELRHGVQHVDRGTPDGEHVHVGRDHVRQEAVAQHGHGGLEAE